MARHSHWHQIRLKKGAADKLRGKLFTKHARLIEIAARSSGDPVMNANLRFAIENARADNLPRENIERAIKKGTGELKGATQMEEIVYEGYGPAGTAFIIDALTDNKNRTSQFVRSMFEKFGGNLGGSGSTNFMFELKGVLNVKLRSDAEQDELDIIDAGAEDVETTNGSQLAAGFIIYTAPLELAAVRKKLQEKGFEIFSAELSKIPKNPITIADPKTAEKLLELTEALEESDDISNVSANFDISPDVDSD